LKEQIIQITLEKVGLKLKKLRIRKGYTSSESFAYDNDLPRVHYWRIEKGKVNLTLRSLIRILAIHKITIEEFFTTDLDDEIGK
jgi:transcriptional regulator with XRE-family HTH domain